MKTKHISLSNRFEDPATGKVNDLLDTPVPESKRQEAKKISDYLGDELYAAANILPGVKAVSQHDLAEMYINNTWRCVCLSLSIYLSLLR